MAQYSILVDVEVQTKNAKTQLQNEFNGIKVPINTSEAEKGLNDLGTAANLTSLSFQAANEVFSKTIDIISSMVEQVYNLDNALVEFRKVSDLSGQSLDNYVKQLTEMGSAVARTGKPKCLAPSVKMVNQH